jgi:hypothetical protein
MSTVFLIEKKCAVCGTISRCPYVDIIMTNVGTKDLDGRSSNIQRSSVYLWIQKCPNCNYCSSDLSTGSPEFLRYINSSEYRNQIFDPFYPETANSFLCNSIILEGEDKFGNSGWNSIFAAWICDDNGFKKSAIECRKRALSLFNSAAGSGQKFEKTGEREQILKIDLFRTIGDFKSALEICSEELKKGHSDQVVEILEFEKELILKRDSFCHNETEAEN